MSISKHHFDYKDMSHKDKLQFILDRPFAEEFAKNFEEISNQAIATGLIAIGMSDERRLVNYVVNERWQEAYFFIEQHKLREGPTITEFVLDLIDERRLMKNGEEFFAPDAMTAIVSVLESVIFADDLYSHVSQDLAVKLLDNIYELLSDVKLLQ